MIRTFSDDIDEKSLKFKTNLKEFSVYIKRVLGILKKRKRT